MYSANVKKFSIRHLLIGSALLSFGLGLVLSKYYVLVTFGIALLSAMLGFFLAYCLFFVSDLIDDRPVDDRRLSSRFFNFMGLLVVMFTVLIVVVLLIIFLLQIVYWILNDLMTL